GAEVVGLEDDDAGVEPAGALVVGDVGAGDQPAGGQGGVGHDPPGEPGLQLRRLGRAEVPAVQRVGVHGRAPRSALPLATLRRRVPTKSPHAAGWSRWAARRKASAARSAWAAETSRWVTTRTRVGAVALARTPRSWSAAWRSRAVPRAGSTSINRMLVWT